MTNQNEQNQETQGTEESLEKDLLSMLANIAGKQVLHAEYLGEVEIGDKFDLTLLNKHGGIEIAIVKDILEDKCHLNSENLIKDFPVMELAFKAEGGLLDAIMVLKNDEIIEDLPNGIHIAIPSGILMVLDRLKEMAESEDGEQEAKAVEEESA